MRLSEGIRLGSMMKPQWKGRTAFNESHTKSCALGAASDAIGAAAYNYAPEWIPLLQRKASCPQCGKPNHDLECAILHLNDDHEWTREQIADWVELQEGPPLPSVSIEELEAVKEGR